jgi:hypothetical protein
VFWPNTALTETSGRCDVADSKVTSEDQSSRTLPGIAHGWQLEGFAVIRLRHWLKEAKLPLLEAFHEPDLQ